MTTDKQRAAFDAWRDKFYNVVPLDSFEESAAWQAYQAATAAMEGRVRELEAEVKYRHEQTEMACNRHNQRLDQANARVEAMPCYYAWIEDDKNDSDPGCLCPRCAAIRAGGGEGK